jgi:hypothetical protein
MRDFRLDLFDRLWISQKHHFPPLFRPKTIPKPTEKYRKNLEKTTEIFRKNLKNAILKDRRKTTPPKQLKKDRKKTEKRLKKGSKLLGKQFDLRIASYEYREFAYD